MAQQLQPGDRVIYRMPKHSACPGRRAKAVRPAPRGENYTYYVEKLRVVAEVRPNGDVVAQTRRGKRHLLEADDPALRLAHWWERLWHGSRFPTLGDAIERLPAAPTIIRA